jgi:hypothetical protein
MGEHIELRERQPLQKERHWENQAETSDSNSQVYHHYVDISEYCDIAQWITDGHIAIKAHDQQDPRLHEGEKMDKEHLGHARIKTDFS